MSNAQSNVSHVPPRLSENALAVLRHRYLIKRPDGSVAETPADMYWRVARAVAAAEYHFGLDARAVEAVAGEFYDLMADGTFLPNSPTLMNAGRELGLLSACFVLPVDDSIEGIFESIKLAALIQKAGGGTGFAFDRLRPTGDYISTSGGTTSGPISFWRIFSEATNAIQQGAFRRGANMGMMNVTHPDVLKFITAKSRLGQFENFNISIKVGDDFVAAVQSDSARPHKVCNPRTLRRYWIPRGLDMASYTLGDLRCVDDPRGPADCWTVGDVWQLLIQSAHATGEPGLCFIDRVNADNPTPLLGRIEATNPCGEQPLLAYEACNLGSINLAKFVRGADIATGRGGRFDEDAFRQAVRAGVRFLDDVVEVNHYVCEPIQRTCTGNRKIGLGVMGLAEALMLQWIGYDSDAALGFARRVARVLSEEAFAASEELARQRGSFPNWSGSRWDIQAHRPMRNAAVTTVAPTGTLSILAGCSGGIEPAFALAYWRNILGGEHMLEINPIFREAMDKRGLWRDDLAARLAGGDPLADIPGLPADLRRVFVTAHDVPPARHVQMQAAFQAHIDGAISKTINLPANATAQTVAQVYLQAYESGCKGITVYRDASRPAQPMGWREAASPSQCPRCQTALPDQVACSRCPKCGYTICS